MREFIDQYLAHIIGLVALVQVWIIAAWKKWIVRAKLEFHPTANIELGFSAFGSTISLPGALRALNKDVFVTEMRVQITRLADKAAHNFTWRAFKSSRLSGPTLTPENIEFASSFTLGIGSPKVLNVFFASENFADRYAQKANAIRSAWSAFLLAKQPIYGAQMPALLQDPAFVDNLFQEYSKSGETLNFYTALNNGFFWHAGDYLIELKVSGASIEDIIYRWQINLSEEEESRLRLNAISTMKEVCNIAVVYDFVYKPYQVVA